MQNKKKKGLTLVELIVVIGIMAFIIAGLVSFVFFMFNQYRTDQIIATDQANIRIATLGITRQIRRGVDVDINPDGDVLTLTLENYTGGIPTRAEYRINSYGFLVRNFLQGNEDDLIGFIGTEMQTFQVERLDSNRDPDPNGNWLRITLSGFNSAPVETTIAIDRITQ